MLLSLIQTNAGADTLHFLKDPSKPPKSGAGDDSIEINGGQELTVNANKGNDTLNWAVAASDAVLSADAGNDYIIGSTALTGSSSVLGGAGADTLEITANTGKYYGGAGADSLYVTMTSGSVYGGASAGDTAAGNDTLTSFPWPLVTSTLVPAATSLKLRAPSPAEHLFPVVVATPST